MLIILYFIIGSCTASFVCLCAYRLGRDELPWLPARSYCDHCHHRLTWWQLIPIISFLLQGGRCCFCRHHLSPFYPAIELIAGFTLASGVLAGAPLLPTCLLLATLLFNTCTDFFYQYVYPTSFIGLLTIVLIIPWHRPTISDLIIATCFLTLTIILQHLSSGLGNGDIEYFFFLFILLGWYATILIILAASLLTLLAFVLVRFPHRLPLMPALCLSTITWVLLQ